MLETRHEPWFIKGNLDIFRTIQRGVFPIKGKGLYEIIWKYMNMNPKVPNYIHIIYIHIYIYNHVVYYGLDYIT